jgi:Domain of unknown function (DU1801)
MIASAHPFANPGVEAVFASFPEPAQTRLLALRALIFDVAAGTPGVGRLEECLKWGQPAYLTPETKSGSTLRLGIPKAGFVAVYAHCQTTIVSDFQAICPDTCIVEGNRAVRLPDREPLPADALRLLVASALTYHLAKRGR